MNRPHVVYESLYREINAFVARRVHRAEDVDDIVQDVFMKLHRHAEQLRDHERVVPWLYRVARNQIIDFYRKKDVKPPVEAEQSQEPSDTAAREVARWLHSFIAASNESDREILTLIELEGKTQKEAAEALGISDVAAKARHQRAKKRLRAALEDCCRYTFDARGRVIDYQLKALDDCCDD